MSKTVHHLGVPSIDLATTQTDGGTLKVALEVPRTTRVDDDVPFLEVTRDAQSILFNGARQDVISKLGKSGFQVGEVQYETVPGINGHANSGTAAQKPVLVSSSFEVSSDFNARGSESAGLNRHPEVVGAIAAAGKNFDTRRFDIYESAAGQWHTNGGAAISSNGETYEVTKAAARGYLDERNRMDPSKSVDGRGETRVAAVLVAGDDRINRHFAQALEGTGGNRDAAALAVDIASGAQGFRPDQPISVLQGRNGFIVSQGDGAAALNLPVPQAKQGDFERVSAQMTQSQQAQQVAAQPDQQQGQRTKAPTV